MKKVSLRVVCGFWLAILSVVGCGQTGPLYLPDHAQHSAGLASNSSPAAKATTHSVASVTASAFSTSANVTSVALPEHSASSMSAHSAP